MRRLACFVLVGAVLPLVGACDLMQLVQGDAVIVTLTNNGAYPVDVKLRISDNQYDLQVVLEEFGDEIDYTVPPGQSVTFFKPCKDLQAILIEKAELSIVGSVGPSISTDILRDGGEFGCGDAIIYTFSHSPILTDFDVTTHIMG